ncbi:MAG: hypothetical protein HY290_30870 [Planctomycetia bacterium]|nr:hypothetical protein [Planctomycetia bacterium]
MVNRITQYLEPSSPPPIAIEDDQLPLHPAGNRWLEFLERQVRNRPSLWLGVAFAAGVGLAWIIKRK